MALKSILTTLDGLSEDVKKEYKEKDGKFYLDVEGIDDHPAVGALKRAKDHEKTLRQEADARARAAEDKALELDTELEGLRTGAVPKSDVEALRKSYEKKTEQLAADYTAKASKKDQLIERHLLDNAALAMATDISTAPSLLIPHIRSRLKVAEVDGDLTVSIMDADGKPSAATLDDLRKEILQNKNFAPILIGSKASGGGANGGSGGGGASKPFKDLSESERVAYAKENPEGFRLAVAEAQKAAASNY